MQTPTLPLFLCGCGPSYEKGVNVGIPKYECAYHALRREGWWQKKCENGVAYKRSFGECPEGYEHAEWVPDMQLTLDRWAHGYYREVGGVIMVGRDTWLGTEFRTEWRRVGE
jgi:hypothetical protein